MQISSENYITVLTEQIKNLTIENAQLRALLLDAEAKAKETDAKTSEKATD